jgi:hypothetical protein
MGFEGHKGGYGNVKGGCNSSKKGHQQNGGRLRGTLCRQVGGEKLAYYTTCYENGKGDTGPWSPVEEAFIR